MSSITNGSAFFKYQVSLFIFYNSILNIEFKYAQPVDLLKVVQTYNSTIESLTNIGQVTARILGFNDQSRLLERQLLIDNKKYPADIINPPITIDLLYPKILSANNPPIKGVKYTNPR